MKLREVLFGGLPIQGCSNHDCIITGPKKGMGTNGSCNCLFNLSRGQLHMLSSRIKQVGEKEVVLDE